MKQTAFDYTPYPANPFKKGSQNWRLYERLKEGPATNVEIMRDLHILNNTGRLSDIRAALRAFGCLIIGTPQGNGIWSYRLVV